MALFHMKTRVCLQSLMNGMIVAFVKNFPYFFNYHQDNVIEFSHAFPVAYYKIH